MDRRASAFGALLTMVSNRRCYVPPELPMTVEGQETSLLIPLSTAIDPDLSAPMPPWELVETGVRQNLSRLSSLPDTDAAAISAAMHMHYCAALLAGSDPSGAHGLAVGGLEVLAHQFGSPPHDWTDWDQAQGWDSFMAEAGLSDEQRRALRNKLMDNTHMRLAETFATYVSQRLPDSFWQDEVRRYVWQFDSATGEDSEGHWADPVTRSQTFPGTRKQLKKALKAAYTVRSGFIHAGKRSLSVRSELMDRPRTERRVPVVRRNASRSSDPSTA